MKRLSAFLTLCLFGLLAIAVVAIIRDPEPKVRDIAEIRARLTPILTKELEEQGLRIGAPVYLRIFKEERQLEVWVQDESPFRLFKTYEICNHSGDLGPKLAEGDRQSPEGFYTVSMAAMNPNSQFHLSFNLGFPNAYDRAHDRTGSFLMVHGACASIGCYAMTDASIEEIYVLAEAALLAGQDAFFVHAFPFRMSDARLAREEDSPWHAFWSDLKAGYDAFETTKIPPAIAVQNNRYAIAGT